MNIKTTFTAANVVLDVVARSMKKSGIAVFLRSKAGKAKAVLGCRTIHKTDADATAAYEKLLADVEAKGWKRGATTAKTGSVGRFAEVPAAPTEDVPAVEHKLTGAAAAAKAKANGKKADKNAA